MYRITNLQLNRKMFISHNPGRRFEGAYTYNIILKGTIKNENGRKTLLTRE
jgi:hypothetical protein